MRKSSLLGAACTFLTLWLSSNLALAIPITYSLNGVLTKLEVTGTFPTLLDAAIDQTVFGSWTGTLTYDVNTAVFKSDIIATDGSIIGADYSGGLTAIDIVLNNGINLTSSSGGVTVYNGSFLPVGYGVTSFFTIPDAFWLTGVAPSEFIPVVSFMAFGVSGVDPINNAINLPPFTLDGSAPNVYGQICGSQTGSVFDPTSDCFSLSGAGDTVTVIPIPPTLWLFGSGLLGLVGMARRKKAT